METEGEQKEKTLDRVEQEIQETPTRMDATSRIRIENERKGNRRRKTLYKHRRKEREERKRKRITKIQKRG
jgi:hypothetical protein